MIWKTPVYSCQIVLIVVLSCFRSICITRAHYWQEPSLHQPTLQLGSLQGYDHNFSSRIEQYEFLRSTAVDCLRNIASEEAILHIVQGFWSVMDKDFSKFSSWSYPLAFDENSVYELSKTLNFCGVKFRGLKESAILDQLALFVWPQNYASALNYAYHLESHGHYFMAKSLYRSCYNYSNYPGCQIHATMVAPYYVTSALHAQYVYLEILRSFYEILSPHSPDYLSSHYTPSSSTYDYMYSLLREVPLISQTLGFAPGRIFNLLSQAISLHYPPLLTMHNFSQIATPQDLPVSPRYMDASFSDDDDVLAAKVQFELLPATPLHPRIALKQRLQQRKQDEEQEKLRQQEFRADYDDDDHKPEDNNDLTSSKRIRIGILSEKFGNTSPGLCMQEVFVHLARRYAMTMSFVFFDRNSMPTVFAHAMRDVAFRTVNINETNIFETVQIIAAEDLDILIFLALPTDKVVLSLAHTRLAGVQILAGIGHPLTSGVSEGIDYVVLPADMLPQEYLYTNHTDSSSSNAPSNRFPIDRHLLHERFSRLDVKYLTARRHVDSLSCAFQAYLCTESHEALYTLYWEYESALADNSIAQEEANIWEREGTLLVGEHCGLSTECFRGIDNSVFYSEQIVLFSSMTHVMLNPVDFHRPNDALVAQEVSLSPDVSLDTYYDSMTGLLLTATQQDPTAETQSEFRDMDNRMFKSERRSAQVYRALRRLAQHRPLFPETVTELSATYLQQHFLSCTQLQEIVVDILHLPTLHDTFFQDAHQFGCYETQYNDQGALTAVTRIPAAFHFYYAVQFTRKMQTEMDEVFVRIFAADPKAVIVVKGDFRVALPRVARMYRRLFPAVHDTQGDVQDTVAALTQRFAFLSSDRISHEGYLGLVALSRVFLNTFPMGAGMTSAEAIAMCTPIVTLPFEMNVLHFADAQLKQIWTLQVEDMKRMVAVNRVDYAAKAVAFGVNDEDHYEENTALRDRLCAGRTRLFAPNDNDRMKRKRPHSQTNQESQVQSLFTSKDTVRSMDDEDEEERDEEDRGNQRKDPEGLQSVFAEDRLYLDNVNVNSVREVAKEWAQFLHRVSAA